MTLEAPRSFAVRGRRRAEFTAFAQRLTPGEVAVHWFRRRKEFANTIHELHPDFPRPAPDGLLLLDDVKLWFDLYHGKRQTVPNFNDAETEALRIARHGRRQNSTSSD